MDDVPKIRIIWIDDRERPAGKPEKTLDPDLAAWFDVVHPSSSDEAVMSYESATAFMQEFGRFWYQAKDAPSLLFPAEIVVTDYNLDKSSAADEAKQEPSVPLSSRSPDIVQATMPLPNMESQIRDVNFDGLLIGTFYASLTANHPSAIVSITNYMGRMPSEVKTLHSLATPLLGVDFEHNLPSAERSWRNIVKEGVFHLRRRIGELYESGDIVLSPSDLMALSETGEHCALNMQSSLASRTLPVQGLFIDFPESERPHEARTWARELMCSVMLDCADMKQAQELESRIWDAYNDDGLFEDRKRLSLLAEAKSAGREYDEAELARLCASDQFNVRNFKIETNGHAAGECSDGYVDITTGNYSGRVCRWAALFVTLRLLKRLALIRKKVKELTEQNSSAETTSPEGPILTLTESDILLALFPIPGAPLTVTWHIGGDSPQDTKKRNNALGTWRRALKRFKQDHDIKKNVGDLALSADDLLMGRGWMTEGPHGILRSERTVLRGLALEDNEMGSTVEERSDAWRGISAARRILWEDGAQ